MWNGGRQGLSRRFTAARLADLSWTEVEAWLVSSPWPAIVLPVGAFEQHGPFLPFATDVIIAERLAADLASELSLLLGPTITVGASDSHLGFPGTVSSGKDLLVALLRTISLQLLGRDDLGRTYQKPGFQRVFLLTAHGGNISALAEAAALDGVEALPGWWELEECKQTIAMHGMTDGAHADETEMSLLLYYGYSLNLSGLPVEGFQAGEDPGPDRPDTRAISPSGILTRGIYRPCSLWGHLLHHAVLRGYTKLLRAQGVPERPRG